MVSTRLKGERMEIKNTYEHVKDVFGMGWNQAKLLDEFLKSNDLSNVLELGFANGVSSCYFASIIKDMGKGHLVTIDNTTAKTREPNIEELLKRTGLEEYVTYYYETVSYNWRLMKFIEENDEPIFDFCYIDGAHDWNVDGFAFLLVDKLLKPGGWIIFDDYDWSYASSPSMKNSPKVLAMSKEEQETPQIQKVFEILVKPHPNYHNFKVLNGNQWAMAQKKE
jgi:predicted O-methyltransferase YrrM